ncbi:flagellar motor switch protein FliN [Hippea alviniae]|uniref:flagellar motor switch protein FliN n=1 Tax=Hippea alviniae TaxID=1279027 RepID=UPI0003B57244|nr:flagellar motor switch protein FliN [Hippea alviniae]
MAAEELSQDEIDSLLNAEETEDNNDKEESSSSDNQIDKDTKRFFDLLNSSIEEVLKTAFSLEVVSKFTDLNIVSKDDVSFENKVFVSVSVSKDDKENPLFILIDKRFASILSDLMLMGPGEAKDELESDDLDAIKELFSQVFGHFSTAVKENIATPLSFEVKEVKLEPSELENNLYKAVYDVALPNIEDGAFEIYSPKAIDELFAVEQLEIETPEEEIPFRDVEEPTFEQKAAPSTQVSTTEAPKNLDLIMDIDLEVKIRIGEKYMLIKDILDLKDGSIIELEKNIEEPMDILVNGKVVAKGVVVVVGGRFGVKITHIETKEERIKSLGG